MCVNVMHEYPREREDHHHRGPSLAHAPAARHCSIVSLRARRTWMSQQPISSFCNPSCREGQPNTVACWPTPNNLYTAAANGKHVVVMSVEKHAVLQLLSPSLAQELVTCVAFSRAGHIAAACTSRVTIFALPTPGDPGRGEWCEVGSFQPAEPVTSLAWAAPSATQQMPALWASGSSLSLWQPDGAPRWKCAWRRCVPCFVWRMAASYDGLLVATIGQHDRLVKVWAPAQGADESHGASFEFCYLRHPDAVASIAWRPPERDAKSYAQREVGDAAILLTSCVNGVPRLWRMSQSPEPMPLRVFLCATLTTSVNGVDRGQHGKCRETLLVHWLEPTSRPSNPIASSATAVNTLDTDAGLSPRARPPPSPLLRPGLGVPTLRPSLRERHDYVVALLADGTLVVWLVLGLSATPRCSPKHMVWATLPSVLPSFEHIITATAFCNFERRISTPTPTAGVELLMPQRADDQLPSAISMLLHTSEAASPMRLCSVNVDRGAAGERFHQRLFAGHGEHEVLALAVNADCAMAASLDAEGVLLLWESEAFGWRTHEKLRSSESVIRRDPNAQFTPNGPWHSGIDPQALLLSNRLPGRFQHVTWLPSTNEVLRLVTFGADGGFLHQRNADAAWAPVGGPIGRAPTSDEHNSWRAIGTFHTPHESTGCITGFALRGNESRLLVWTVQGTLQSVGEISLNRTRGTAVTCIAAISSAGGTKGKNKQQEDTYEVGSVLCGYSDGACARWDLRCSHGAAKGYVHATMSVHILGMVGGEPDHPHVPHAISVDGQRAAILYHQISCLKEGQSQPHRQLRIVEYAACDPEIQDEFVCEVQSTIEPTCAFMTLANGVGVLAVSCDSEIVLYAQTWHRQADGTPDESRWAAFSSVRISDGPPCTSISWTRTGSLIVGSGPFLLMWPQLLRAHAGTLSRRDYPQWHPSILLQQFLSDPSRPSHVLDHLASLDVLVNATPLPLVELLHGCNPDVALHSARESDAAGANSASQAEDLFAPQPTARPSIDDLFAPSPTKRDLFAGIEEPSTNSNLLEVNAETQGPAAKLLKVIDAETGVLPPGLNAYELKSLLGLLHAQKTVEAAGTAVDASGARFVLCALAGASAEPPPVPVAAVAWALLSECPSTLLDICISKRSSTADWPSLRALGVGFWLPQGDALNRALEGAAKAHFTRRKEPEDCALLYIALGKKKQLEALCKAVRDERMHSFLSNDFTTERWRSAAMKNAYSLLSKQRFELAIAFFLLADELGSALKVCTRQLGDLQLSLVLCRLFARKSPDALRTTVREDLLPRAVEGRDVWLCCVAHLLLGEPAMALKALARSCGTQGQRAAIVARCGLSSGSFEPSMVAFYAHLMGNARWRLQAAPIDPQLLIRGAYACSKSGGLLLAIETLCGGKGDKRAPLAGREMPSSPQISQLICMALLDEAAHIIHKGARPNHASSLMEELSQLRSDAQLLCAHANVPIDLIKKHAEEEVCRAGLTENFLQHFMLLGALQLWLSCRTILEYSLNDVEAMLSRCMPHELPQSSCIFLSKAMLDLHTGVATLIQERSGEGDGPLQARVSEVGRRAIYALCCSGRKFLYLLEWLHHSCAREESDAAVRETLARLSTEVRSSMDEPFCMDKQQRYVWARFHLCCLQYLRRHEESRSHDRVQGSTATGTDTPRQPPPPLQLELVDQPHDLRQDSLLMRWILLCREESRLAISCLSPDCFPLDPVATLSKDSHEAVSRVLDHISDLGEERDALADTQVVEHEPFTLYPLDDEVQGCIDTQEYAPTDVPALDLCPGIDLFTRRGDFVRAVCVNALNSCQLALCLSRGVHQLELSRAPSNPSIDGATDANSGNNDLTVTVGSDIDVQQSVASDFNARCLCAHPKLPLYLAGGDAVVQCWQFGQSIQGQGLHDHLRAQYKLPAGGHVANIQISPDCEWFSSLDQAGFLSLWRFQSGSDMPLPFSRLQCHSKRGADLCFVDSSVVLATVGQSGGAEDANSLCLWDVLLPPDKALVSSCAAHAEGGRCVVHCASEMSLISGGEKGEMVIFDLRQRRIREKWSGHAFAVQSLVIADNKSFFSASADASIKLWSMDAPCEHEVGGDATTILAEGQPRAKWPQAHDTNILSPLVGNKLGQTGVTSLTLMPQLGGIPGHVSDTGSTAQTTMAGLGLISGGADGKVKMWRYA